MNTAVHGSRVSRRASAGGTQPAGAPQPPTLTPRRPVRSDIAAEDGKFPATGMKEKDRREGFSLIEVVFAVGLLVLAAIPLLALLPVADGLEAEARDFGTAASLAESIRLEAEYLIPVADFPDFEELPLAAARDGTGLQPFTAELPAAAGYFRVNLAATASAPLDYSPDNPLLVLQVRITWPGSAGTTAAGRRGELQFFIGLRP